MAARPSILLVLAGALSSLGASVRTPNFVVEAPTPEVAQQIGQYAEQYRREKAIQWLGQEMPTWGRPCPLRATVQMSGAGGATQFAFDGGQILSIDMHIEGSLDRLLMSVLPHEVTHTVIAYYFRCPVPRWADEGGSVLSEDDAERARHDSLVRQILRTPGRAIPLRRLFALKDYPRDVMVLYAEGYSVTNYLVGLGGRSQFLAFVAQGMRGDWDGAVRAYYRLNTVEELERAWLQSLSSPRPEQSLLASNQGSGPVSADPARRVVVRQTVPPAQPLLEAPQPVYRGQAPEEEAASQSWTRPAPAQPTAWPPPQPQQAPPPGPPQVHLGAPQFDTAPPPPYAQPSPVGWSP
jgi:hypothetical protein